jgi:hypothetical protein
MSELTLEMLEADRRVNFPNDGARRSYIIDTKFENGVWYLWEYDSAEIGYTVIKTGSLQTIAQTLIGLE